MLYENRSWKKSPYFIYPFGVVRVIASVATVADSGISSHTQFQQI